MSKGKNEVILLSEKESNWARTEKKGEGGDRDTLVPTNENLERWTSRDIE